MVGGLTLLPGRDGRGAVLRVRSDGTTPLPHLVAASYDVDRGELVAPCTPEVVAMLRELVPWLRPFPLGLRPALGLGDRLGLATPGHIAALRSGGDTVGAVLAQQSVREMSRTGRTPQDVLDDATWGVFEAGWVEGFGADADHIRRLEDLDACARAGYTMFTIDPGDVLAAEPDVTDPASDLLPWADVEDTWADLRRRWAGTDEDALAGTVVQYLPALAYVVRAVRRLAGQISHAYDVEVAVDESGVRTTELAHRWLTTELRRLGIPVRSFAPCFVGAFEKGVDYVGDSDELRRDVALHAAVARTGPHKLSVHSGSDKFSLYPLLAEEAGDLLHLKTSGTSWLTALRVAAVADPQLLRELFAFAVRVYEQEVRSYHVSAGLQALPDPRALADSAVPTLLESRATRQVLHVTYGAVLTADGGARFKAPLLSLLADRSANYSAALADHLGRHLAAFPRRA